MLIENPKTGLSFEVGPDLAVYELAYAVQGDWQNVNFAAKPYLDAMLSLNKVSDMYYQDPGEMIVAYFLSNASSWRGPVAKAVKAELRRRIA